MTTPRGSYKIRVREKKSKKDTTLQDLYAHSEFGGDGENAKENLLDETDESLDNEEAEAENDDNQTNDFLSDIDKNSSKRAEERKEEDQLNKDINDFLDAEEEDPTKLKEKESVKRARHKKAKRDKRNNRAKKILLAIIVVAAFTGLGVFATLSFFTPTSNKEFGESEGNISKADEIYYSRLTGLPVANKDAISGPATCVMIENSTDARPQSGLSEAGVVYEAIAEGGITRFMAVFQDQKPALVGPVRSVRLTYAQFAKPYHCSIAHVGGSGNALNLIRNNTEFRDIDQFFNDSSYWRAKTKPNGKRIWAPHNVYTNFEKLDALNSKRGYNNSDFTGLKRVMPDSIAADSPMDATQITIRMSSDNWNPSYEYDPATKTYLRSHVGTGPHIDLKPDGSAVQNAPRVVIALKSDAYQRSSERQYQDYTTIGSNEAFIFQNGTVTSAKWQRESENDELHFVDSEGNDVPLERGQVWITIYPSQSGSVTWN